MGDDDMGRLLPYHGCGSGTATAAAAAAAAERARGLRISEKRRRAEGVSSSVVGVRLTAAGRIGSGGTRLASPVRASLSCPLMTVSGGWRR